MWTGVAVGIVLATNMLTGAQQTGLPSLAECQAWLDRAHMDLPAGDAWIGGACYATAEPPVAEPVVPKIRA